MGNEQIYDRAGGHPVAKASGHSAHGVTYYVLAAPSLILSAIDSACLSMLRGVGVIFVIGWDAVLLRRPCNSFLRSQ